MQGWRGMLRERRRGEWSAASGAGIEGVEPSSTPPSGRLTGFGGVLSWAADARWW